MHITQKWLSGRAMRAKRFMWLYCAALMATALLISNHSTAADLLEAYRLAKDSDPTFASARYALDSARQKIPQARANLLPSASVTGNDNVTRAKTEFTGMDPVDRSMQAWTWNLQLKQPLVRVDTIYAYRESKYLVEQAEAQFAQSQQDLLLRVAQAYFNVNVAQDAIAAADAQVAALEQQLAQVTQGYKLGTHSLTDIDDTRSRLGTARSQRVAAQNDLESAQADLEKVTGKTLYQLKALSATVILPSPNPANSRSWMEQARTSHPLVRAQRAALEAAREEVARTAPSTYLRWT